MSTQPRRAVVSHAETLLLTETIGRVGLDRALSAAREPWRPRFAVHDPTKVLLDLAVGLAVGGDCLADIALWRAEPAAPATAPFQHRNAVPSELRSGPHPA